MANLFVRVAKKTTFNTLNKEQYKNSIVFIEDSQEIWSNDIFYAIPEEYKNKISSLETAQSALKYFSKISSDGANTFEAAGKDGTIVIKGQGATTVTASTEGFVVNTPVDTLTSGESNGTVKFNGTEVSVYGLQDAAYRTAASFDDAIAEAKKAGDDAMTEAKAKVASVSGSDAIVVSGTATAPVIGLKIAESQGNVTLSQTADGLKASVVIPEDSVLGVDSQDMILTIGADKLLKTSLSLHYDSDNKMIQLLGQPGVIVSEINASAFIKDGMLNTASFNESTKKLTLSFNTDAGIENIEVDLTSLVDTYNGQNLKLTAASGFETDTILDSAIQSLKTSVDAAAASGVLSLGGKTGTITLAEASEANGSVNLSMNENALSASVVGLKSAAYTESSAYAIAEQGVKADSAIQSIEATNTGTYISVGASVSDNKIALTPSLTMGSMNADGKGVAEVSDVKTYIDNLFAWTIIE